MKAFLVQQEAHAVINVKDFPERASHGIKKIEKMAILLFC